MTFNSFFVGISRPTKQEHLAIILDGELDPLVIPYATYVYLKSFKADIFRGDTCLKAVDKFIETLDAEQELRAKTEKDKRQELLSMSRQDRCSTANTSQPTTPSSTQVNAVAVAGPPTPRHSEMQTGLTNLRLSPSGRHRYAATEGNGCQPSSIQVNRPTAAPPRTADNSAMPPGLINIGNTCYLNVWLQCLLACSRVQHEVDNCSCKCDVNQALKGQLNALLQEPHLPHRPTQLLNLITYIKP